MSVCLIDIVIGTELTNITVYSGTPNVTVTYHLREPFVGRTINYRNISLTPEQRVIPELMCIAAYAVG